MRKVILYTASSLDGYIAGPNHDLDWLFDDDDYGYHSFYDSVSSTLMGNATYRLVLTFGDFPYKDKENFVFTRNSELKNNEHVQFVSANISGFVRDLKSQQGSDIWLIGGGQVNTLFLNNGLIDEMIISVHPVILGKGIPLFPAVDEPVQFKMSTFHKYKSGLVQITYKK